MVFGTRMEIQTSCDLTPVQVRRALGERNVGGGEEGDKGWGAGERTCAALRFFFFACFQYFGFGLRSCVVAADGFAAVNRRTTTGACVIVETRSAASPGPRFVQTI